MSLDDYDRLKVIGKGSYGEVWLAKHKADKKQYVLKKMDLRKASKRERLAAEQEAKLLSDLKHPNIVAYKDTFEGGDGYLYIAMGYCERGDLYTRLKEQKSIPLEERHVVEWFVQIAMALQYMHERNILHRDLKTQNIFLTKNKIIKVGDLGIARVLDSSSDMATTLIGTPYYMSPELFSNKPYNFKSDVWALGCCVYEMTTLKHAFNAKDMNALMYRVLRGKLPPMPDMYRKELVDLIKAMLNKNPEKRPSVNRILRDPYIKENIAIFLEGTKSNPNLNRRPGSACKKDRPSSRDGNRPRRPKPEPLSLEPLNTGQDILEPIKEEATPRESIEVRSSLPDHQKNNSKDLMDVNDNGPMEAKLEKNNSGRDGVGSSSEVLPQNSPVTADVEKPRRQHSSGSKNKDRRNGKHSKLSKKGIVADVTDDSKVSAQEIKVFPPPNEVDQTDLVSITSATSENASVVVYRRFNEDSNSNYVSTSIEKVRPTPSNRKSSSSKSKPPLPESRSSLSDFIMPLSEPNSPVIKSPPSDFELPKGDSPSVVSERRSSKSEARSSVSSDSKPPVPASSRSSASVPCPSKSESSPYASGISASKSRSSPSRRRSVEGDACFTEQQKSDSKCRPLPPRPTSSSINPEPSKAIIYKSSKVNQANGDSGRSSSTSSSGYSGREEVGDQLDERASESISRASQEMPVPMRSIESSARQRRRLQQQQQQQQTPRISKSVDVTRCPPEFQGSGPAGRASTDSSRQERHFRSVDYDNQHSRSEGEKKPLINHTDPLESELEKRRIRNSSNGSGSSSEDEEESTSRAEKREQKKEIDSFINLLGTTLRLQRKSKDSDDEGDSGVEAVPDIPKPNKAKVVCGATYLMSAPSPLPPGSKYPYVDENSAPISARNRRVRQRIPDESANLDIPDKAVDPLDSAISMTTTGRLFDRISVLRKDCIHALGVEKLKIAYDILDCFDTDELEPQLVKLLGTGDFEAYAGKIFQLKFCEESAFKAQ